MCKEHLEYWLTTAEVAHFLKCDEQEVEQMIHRSEFHSEDLRRIGDAVNASFLIKLSALTNTIAD